MWVPELVSLELSNVTVDSVSSFFSLPLPSTVWASPRGWALWCYKRAVSIIKSTCLLFFIQRKIESFLSYLTKILRFLLIGPLIGLNLGHFNQYLWWRGGIILMDYSSKTLPLKLMEGFIPPKNMTAVESRLGRWQIFYYIYSGEQWIQGSPSLNCLLWYAVKDTIVNLKLSEILVFLLSPVSESY